MIQCKIQVQFESQKCALLKDPQNSENTFSYTEFTGEFESEVRKTKFWWKSTFLGGT